MIDLSLTEKLSDEELVIQTLKDQDFFIVIINRYQTKLFNYIRRISNLRDEDVEDLMQDIFLKVYINLNDFDADLKFSSWIYSIAHNQVISNFRKLQARVEGHKAMLGDEDLKNIIANVDLEKSLDTELLRSRVNQALIKLEARYREVIILRYLEEKNYQEISDIIKRPVGTVGSMINKAKQELKKQLIKQV